MGLCGIHANSRWARGPAACNAVCTPYAVPQWTGPEYLGWFKSEFGQNVWPSFESISAQLSRNQWSMNSGAAAQRNHKVKSVVHSYYLFIRIELYCYEQAAYLIAALRLYLIQRLLKWEP